MIQVLKKASSPATSPCEPPSENWVKPPPDCPDNAPGAPDHAPDPPDNTPDPPDNPPVPKDRAPDSNIREQKFNSTSSEKLISFLLQMPPDCPRLPQDCPDVPEQPPTHSDNIPNLPRSSKIFSKNICLPPSGACSGAVEWGYKQLKVLNPQTIDRC